jgi:hypothetical protein
LRGQAWGLRDLLLTAGWVPDTHPQKTYFTTIAQNNLNDHEAYADALQAGTISFITPANTALDAIYVGKRPEDQFGGAYQNKTWLSGFEQPYLASVFHFGGTNQGWTGFAKAQASLLTFWPRLADVAQIPAPFDITFMSPYVIAVGSRTYGPSTFTLYTTMQEMYGHTYHPSIGGVDGPLPNAGQQNLIFLRPLFQIAAAVGGYAGAAAGLAYINTPGGYWDSTYRVSAENMPFAFAAVTVPN